MFSTADYKAAAEAIQTRITIAPRVGLILGSGLGGLADAVASSVSIDGADIPNWPRSTVEGHKGRLVIGMLEGQPVFVVQGRAHFYEGNSMAQTTFPVRVMQQTGVETLIVTNAAGGLNPGFSAGDLMLITDHINFLGMAGVNPLIGPNDPALGPRFPGLVGAYDLDLADLARTVAKQQHVTLREGVYVALAGPFYETPAEIRMLRLIGGDAVGMSTAPEVIVARHAGMRVLGFSGITNQTIDSNVRDRQTDHAEVIDVGDRLIVPALSKLLLGVLQALPKPTPSVPPMRQ